MWQLMQSDEYVNIIVTKDSTKKVDKERMNKYQEVFDLNKTSLPEFKKSYAFYMAHPDISKVMFDSMSSAAMRQREEFYKPKADSSSGPKGMQRLQMEKHKADSLTRSGTALPHPINAKMDSISVKQNMLRFQMEKRRLDSLSKIKMHQPVNTTIKPDSISAKKIKKGHHGQVKATSNQ